MNTPKMSLAGALVKARASLPMNDPALLEASQVLRRAADEIRLLQERLRYLHDQAVAHGMPEGHHALRMARYILDQTEGRA